MTHRHVGERKVACVAIDEHVCLRPTVHGGASHITNADGSIAGGETEHLAGFLVAHDREGQPYRCEGAVNVDPHFEGERPVWGMTGSLEGGDLTLSPSIHETDGQHDFHGFVRNGKWVPVK